MTKKEIFQDLVQLMENDYAGYQDKHVDATPYLERVHEGMSEASFENLVWDYDRAFQDGHVNAIFLNTEPFTVGFEVRRDQAGLFIVKVNDSQGVVVGDEIVKLDDDSIDEAAHLYEEQLAEAHERQDWDWLVERYHSITLATGEQLPLTHYPDTMELKKAYEQIDDKTGLLTLEDFANPDELKSLLDSKYDQLEKLEYLIVDIRTNYGGTDETFWELLNYFVTEPTNLRELYPENYNYTTHWTPRNRHNWLNTLETIKEEYHNDYYDKFYAENVVQWENEETAKIADQERIANPDNPQLTPKGQIKHIYVLTDVKSISAADEFALLAKRMKNVTTVGRNTLGIVDYVKIARQYYDNLMFLYPTTRQNLIDSGEGMLGVGVEPNVFIPWTHESINHDPDMAWVLHDIAKLEEE
ncbi:S41 family peptidase [Weissella viridescens]|uniref:S41 family peptidase n=1 Tax=Weissella viridescens TaxID=1629 RepID=UPI003AF2993E